MERRCMLCGRKFQTESLEDEFLEKEEDIFSTPKKPSSVCPLCQAKLRHEAEDAQKNPKPV